MATWSNTYGSAAMMASIADAVSKFETGHMVDVHTITLSLSGQHGEFDLTVEATNGDMEDVKMTAIAHRYGGVSTFQYHLPT